MSDYLTIQEAALEARKWFTTTRRNDETIWITKEGHPDWVKDMCMDAHGDMLPDDYKYEFIVNSLDAIIDNDDEDDARDCTAPDIYTHDLLKWLASSNSRFEYVDDVRQEYNFTLLTPEASLMDEISMGQQSEREEVFYAVFYWLEGHADGLVEEQAITKA